MKFLVKSVINILIFLVILIIPVTLFVTFMALGNSELPLWNIGIRNVLSYAREYLVPSIFISYLFATLLVVARVDKMKVKSLFLLHLPPIIVVCIIIIGGGLFSLREKEGVFKLPRKSVQVGPLMFLKRDVFTNAGTRQVLLKWETQGKHTLYYYDTQNNSLSIINNVYSGKTGRNQLYVDDRERTVVIKYRNLPKGAVSIPYSDFPHRENTTDMPIFRSYEKQTREIYGWLRKRGSLQPPHSSILFGALLLTFLMISVPLVYAMNDTGWGFSGIIGVFLVLALLPFFYNFMIKIVDRSISLMSFMGDYAYLFPALVFGICGLLLDLIVKARRRAKS
jgi:hypothetical protein